jgi:N-acetylmuramoyl-L-alanine amidase
LKKAQLCLSLFVCAVGITVAASAVSAAAPMTKGSRSEQVLDLQQRLKTLGYFNDGTTGYYGTLTTESVRKFQKDNKLPVNGVADAATVAKLMQKSGSKQSQTLSPKSKAISDPVPKTKAKPVPKPNPQLNILLKQSPMEQLARIIHSEARGESFKGQVAVGSVVLNRVDSSEFPDTIGEVIFQEGQFTAVDDGQYLLEPNQSAYSAAQAALNGSDETKGALYYYNPRLATSSWSMSRPTIKKIGSHVFTR